MYRKKRAGGSVRLCAFVLMLVMACVAMVIAPQRARAESVEDHVVQTSAPRTTRVDMFDYWLQDQHAVDYAYYNQPGFKEQGINIGHKLLFMYSTRGESGINEWHAGRPYLGIVQSTLDENGYPRLSEQYGRESLAYLFDGSDESSGQPGKAVYPNATGLFQLDGDGYYHFDSQKEFASFDPLSGTFRVYDTWGVKASKLLSSNHDGQFFPFDRADTVFDVADGSLVQRDVTPTTTNLDTETNPSPSLNHWFGMKVTSEVYQREGGTVGGKPITYELTGDDDVWVFIDGVLVADMGGIHGARSIQINLQTGSVNVFEDRNGDGTWQQGEPRYNSSSTDTLRECFRAAGREDATSWQGDTFADETEHTVNLFYLERGSGSSNLKMRFNLAADPDPAPRAAMRLVKTLTGADIQDGFFSATLTPVTSDTATAAEAAQRLGGVDAETGEKNVGFPAAARNEDGVAASSVDLLSDAEFGADDVGKTFAYEVRELVPDPVPTGYTYDASSYRLAISVTRSGAVISVTERLSDEGGDVIAEASYTNEADSRQTPVTVTFENAYAPLPTGIVLRAAKVLDGRELRADEFTFELREGGVVLDTQTNAADGSVTFDRIAYDQPGEHDYQIVEVPGDEKGVTYDNSVYTVHVSVADDVSRGSLVATWSYGTAGAPVFHNAYSEPSPAADGGTDHASTSSGKAAVAFDAHPVPDTGDATMPTVLLVLLALGVAAFVAARRLSR